MAERDATPKKARWGVTTAPAFGAGAEAVAGDPSPHLFNTNGELESSISVISIVLRSCREPLASVNAFSGIEK